MSATTNPMIDILQSKIQNIEEQIIQREKAYKEEIKRIEDEYNAELNKLTEDEKTLLELQKTSTKSDDIESLENLKNTIDKIELSEEELESIWTFLALSSTKNLNKNKQVNAEITEEKKEKEIIAEQSKDKEDVNKEQIKIVRKQYEEDKEDKIDLTEWHSLSESEKQDLIRSLFDETKKQIDKRTNDEEEFEYLLKGFDIYNKAINDGIIEENSDFAKILSDYNNAYNDMQAEYQYLIYRKNIDKKINISDEVYEHLISAQKSIEKCRSAFNKIARIHKKIAKPKENLSTPENTPVEEKLKEEPKRKKVKKLVSKTDIVENDIEEEYTGIAEIAKDLLDKYNMVKDNPKYKNNSSLKSIGLSIDYLKQYLAKELTMDKTEQETWEQGISDTIDFIVSSLDEEIESLFFPKANNEYSNIGSKNIILFLDNNGISTIENDLDSLDLGEKTQIASELKYALESKYKKNSWITNLKSKSDHLKGSKVRIGKQDNEIWNCKCGTRKTRMSLLPLTVNVELKDKLKEKYNLPDTFESVLLICNIAPYHNIDYLMKMANKNSEAISKLNDLFSNPDASFELIEEIIKDSSAAYDRISERTKKMK